jgi:hypothetical protein
MFQFPVGPGQAPSASLLASIEAVRHLPITIVGQSHVECMRGALSTAGDRLRVINLWHFSDPLKKEERQGIEGMRELFDGVVVSVLIGAGFEEIAMYRHSRPFDFVSPSEPDEPLDPEAELIPFDAARKAVFEKIEHTLSVIDRLRELTAGLMLQVEPPPVWGHERKAADWPPGFFDATDSFGPRYLRRKVYRLHNEIVGSFCSERGIEIISPPPETINEEGFLKPEFSNDPVHANQGYGHLLAERILRRIAVLARVA